MTINKQIKKMLKDHMKMLRSIDSDEAEKLYLELKAMAERLERPLRVAIVGIMKAGKSTLMNALLKEQILFTNILEATYTVSWFKYGEQPGLKVVYNNGEARDAPFEELEKWTARPMGEDKTFLDDVKYVEIYYPNEILKTMELIDTPGLESTFEKDAEHTKDFLGMVEKAEKMTSVQASLADAIIYGFSRGAGAADLKVLEAFIGESVSNSSPINAIGVFTKCDLDYWNCGEAPDENPIETVLPALDKYKKALKTKLYTILPIVAKPIEAASTLSEEELTTFEALSKLDTTILTDYLNDATIFATMESDEYMTVPASERKRVLDKFGKYGVYMVSKALENGVTREALVDYLYDVSGIQKISERMTQHFGNRAFLIKVEYIFSRIMTMGNKIKYKTEDTQLIRICERIIDDMMNIKQNEQAFLELGVLQAYYNGDMTLVLSKEEQNMLKIPAEMDYKEVMEQELLEICGEYGSNCEARLGFKELVSIKDMKKEAAQRVYRWNSLSNFCGASKNVGRAAATITKSLESLYHHLEMLSGYEQ